MQNNKNSHYTNHRNEQTKEDNDYKKRQLVLHHRYEWWHIINDVLIAVWFLIGSFFFFSESLTYFGTWLFVLGSLQMLIRPSLRIAHKLHVKDIETDNINF